MIINPYLVQPSGDVDALSFITAAGITDNTQKSAINTLVSDLKLYGIWTKMKAIYPFVGGTASSHSYNLKDASQYQLTWQGGLTHSSTGVLPNGTNGRGINTAFDLVTSNSGLSPINNHLSFYSRTNTATPNGVDVAATTNVNHTAFQSKNLFNNGSMWIMNNNFYISPTNTNATGFYIATATASNAVKIFKNGSNTLTTSTALTTFAGTGQSFSVFEGYAGLYSAREGAFATIGEGLTDTEVSNFYTAVQAFQTTLGRQV